MRLTEELSRKIRDLVEASGHFAWADAWLFGVECEYVPTRGSGGFSVAAHSAPPEYNQFRLRDRMGAGTLAPLQPLDGHLGAAIREDERGWACLYVGRRGRFKFVYILVNVCGDVSAHETFACARQARDALVARADQPPPDWRPAEAVPEDYYAP